MSKIRTYYFAKIYLCVSFGVDFSYKQTPGFKSRKFTAFMFSKFYKTVFCYYLLIVSVVLLYINSSVWANEAKFWRLCSFWDPWPDNVEILLPRNLALRWQSSRVRGDYAKIYNPKPIIRHRSSATIKHHLYYNVSTSLFFPAQNWCSQTFTQVNIYGSHSFWLSRSQLPVGCTSTLFWLRASKRVII